MPARVTHLLDDLEARLADARTEIATLREDNRRLKRRLAQLLAAENDALAAAEADPVPAADPAPPSPQALLRQWQSRYPPAFAGDEARPLKVGIHHDLAAREPWSTKLIRRALAGYVNRPRYVKALKEGATRVDLDGNPAGTVDATAAQAAQEKHRRQAAAKKDRPVAKKPRAAKASRPANAQGGGPAGQKKAKAAPPASGEARQQPAEPSLEDKLASLQRRFGGQG